MQKSYGNLLDINTTASLSSDNFDPILNVLLSPFSCVQNDQPEILYVNKLKKFDYSKESKLIMSFKLISCQARRIRKFLCIIGMYVITNKNLWLF